MILSGRLRKFALTAHVCSSVGWLGALGAFLALAIAGLGNHDAQVARAAYVAMDLTTWWVIVPMAFASLLTGLVVSLGTTWGLFRHYWVLVKFLITVFATILLLVHTQPIGVLADTARTSPVSGDLHRLQIQALYDAILAIAALLVATVLALYKPRGVTRYGWRKEREERATSQQ
jgi:hypothetical protein